jgi:hypothetical protein
MPLRCGSEKIDLPRARLLLFRPRRPVAAAVRCNFVMVEIDLTPD